MNAATFFLVAFIATLVLPYVLTLLLGPLERAFPRRVPQTPVLKRWQVHIPLALAGAGIGYLASYYFSGTIGAFGARISPLSLAKWDIPSPLKFTAGFLLIDLMNYVLHWLSHQSGFLWRFHKIHHSDNEFDASTGLRHQPLEGVINMLILTLSFGVLGMPFVIIAAYGVVFAVHSVLSHANIAIPPSVDKILRLFIVTPDMHRLHHAESAQDYNSNFGQILPLWDALFRTLNYKPVESQVKMSLGLKNERNAANLSAWQLTLLPFVNSGKSSNTKTVPKSNTAENPRGGSRSNSRPKKAKQKR